MTSKCQKIISNISVVCQQVLNSRWFWPLPSNQVCIKVKITENYTVNTGSQMSIQTQKLMQKIQTPVDCNTMPVVQLFVKFCFYLLTYNLQAKNIRCWRRTCVRANTMKASQLHGNIEKKNTSQSQALHRTKKNRICICNLFPACLQNGKQLHKSKVYINILRYWETKQTQYAYIERERETSIYQ